MEMWTLGIDFGTSATAVAVAVVGQPARPINFGTLPAMPSAILATEEGSPDGPLIIGAAAVAQRRRAPERFEANPKRHMGEAVWFLGRPVDPVQAVAAILRAAAVAAARQFDGRPPARIVLTHPAGWEATKLDQFTRAAALAGLRNPVLVPEPLAAAAFYAAEAGRPPGRTVAVYDLGGGTFDAAVVDATNGSFTVRRSGGLDYVGGVAFDHILLELVGRRIAAQNPAAWDALSAPMSPADLQARSLLTDDVRTAKEALSDRQQTALFVPALGTDVLVTRKEFEDAIRPDVDASVDSFLRTVADAGARLEDLSAVYLVGGSSAVPLVSDTLFRRLGRRPITRNDPKAVVALGAASWPEPTRPAVAPAPATGSPPTGGAPRAGSAPLYGNGPGSPGPGAPQPAYGPAGVQSPSQTQPPQWSGQPGAPGGWQQAPRDQPPAAPAGIATGGARRLSPAVLGGAVAALVVILAVVIFLVVHKSGGSTTLGGGGGTTSSHTSSTVSSSTASSSSTSSSNNTGSTTASTGTTGSSATTESTDTAGTVPAADPTFVQFSTFRELVGTQPAEPSKAYANATCVAISDKTTLTSYAAGATAGVRCTTSNGLQYAVYRFADQQNIANNVATLVTEGFQRNTWGPNGSDVGDAYSATNTTTGAGEIVTTFTAEPAFLVDMQGPSASLESFWTNAPLPTS